MTDLAQSCFFLLLRLQRKKANIPIHTFDIKGESEHGNFLVINRNNH